MNAHRKSFSPGNPVDLSPRHASGLLGRIDDALRGQELDEPMVGSPEIDIELVMAEIAQALKTEGG